MNNWSDKVLIWLYGLWQGYPQQTYAQTAPAAPAAAAAVFPQQPAPTQPYYGSYYWFGPCFQEQLMLFCIIGEAFVAFFSFVVIAMSLSW